MRQSATELADVVAVGPSDRDRLGVTIREPAEVVVREGGLIELPLSVLAEAGISIGAPLLAYSDGDGRIVLRREADALDDLLNGRLL